MDEPKWLGEIDHALDLIGGHIDKEAGRLLLAHVRELRAALADAQGVLETIRGTSWIPLPPPPAWLARQRVLDREGPPELDENGGE